MPDNSPTLADRFLTEARDTQQLVSLYLVNGFQLKGPVVEFDSETILFKHKNVHQMVMRAAVANMFPMPRPRQEGEEWWRKYGPATSG